MIQATLKVCLIIAQLSAATISAKKLKTEQTSLSSSADEIEAEAVVELHWHSGSVILDPRHSAITVQVGDIVEIVCPFNFDSDSATPSDLEYFTIFLVDQQGFDACSVENAETSREVGSCLTPFDPNVIRFHIRSESPEPHALAFKPKHTYYFISTSTGKRNGLENTKGGLCKQKNHRLMIYVDDVFERRLDPYHGERNVPNVPKIPSLPKRMMTASMVSAATTAETHKAWHTSSETVRTNSCTRTAMTQQCQRLMACIIMLFCFVLCFIRTFIINGI